MNHNDSKTALRLIELQLDLAEADLQQLRSSHRSSRWFFASLLLALLLLLAFPLSSVRLDLLPASFESHLAD